MVISINLFYLDAIDEIFFKRNVSGNSSVVTLTKEESFAEQQKKDAQKNSTWISETEEEVCTERTREQHANERNSDSGSIEEGIRAEQSKDEGKFECIICNNYKFKFRIQHLTIAFVPNYGKIKIKSVACGA